ncbi:unnamed protein product, partial [Laminaria digitata]
SVGLGSVGLDLVLFAVFVVFLRLGTWFDFVARREERLGLGLALERGELVICSPFFLNLPGLVQEKAVVAGGGRGGNLDIGKKKVVKMYSKYIQNPLLLVLVR